MIDINRGRHPARRPSSVRAGDPVRLRREIGYVIQQIRAVSRHATIGEKHRHGPAAARVGEGARARPASSSCSSSSASRTSCANRYPGAALRRPAPARRRRPGAPCRRPAADAHGTSRSAAIDPHQPRARLQDEFPAPAGPRSARTVVFVHPTNIDEAIKNGRTAWAILRQGRPPGAIRGRPRRSSPARSTTSSPRFVGKDRAPQAPVARPACRTSSSSPSTVPRAVAAPAEHDDRARRAVGDARRRGAADAPGARTASASWASPRCRPVAGLVSGKAGAVVMVAQGGSGPVIPGLRAPATRACATTARFLPGRGSRTTGATCSGPRPAPSTWSSR